MNYPLRTFAVAFAIVAVAACGDQLVDPEAFDATGPASDAALVTPSACTFTTTGNVMQLDADCTTDMTIVVPDGMTLDGNGHTITAVDPAGDHFRGAVVASGGATGHVMNVVVTTYDLTNACDGGADRLRGIMFEGTSGSITRATVTGVNQGPSGCQEGNGIEVRNAPFDGTHPNTVTVEVSGNTVVDYQKTGIVANGDVDVRIENNEVGASATQENLAANSIQLGFGALGSAVRNQVDGNQWKGTSNFAASAILVFAAGPVEVSQNVIQGNSDIGVFGSANQGTYENNKVFDRGADHPNSGFDIGVGVFGSDNQVGNNKIRGFDVAVAGISEGTNKAIPSPNN